MKTLTLGTCQAQNSVDVVREIAAWLTNRLEFEVEFRGDGFWQDQYAALDAGEMDIGWICGLPYVRRADAPDKTLSLLAAPVMRGERYQGRPVYFSDVLVAAGSGLRVFDDLRGCIWGINEPGSLSGYGAIRYHLATLGETFDYFGSVVETGAHQESIRRIISGEIEASAVDSTVLELELARDPSLAHRLRALDALGPNPQPPWVIDAHVPLHRQRAVREALLSMHTDHQGRLILAAGLMDRFVSVSDSDYEQVRRMIQVAGL